MPIDKFGRTSAIAPPSTPRPFQPHYNLTSDGSIDWGDRRLTGIKRAEESLDCVTKEFLEDYTAKIISELQLKIDDKFNTTASQIETLHTGLEVVLQRIYRNDPEHKNHSRI